MEADILAGLGQYDPKTQALLDKAWAWTETINFSTTIVAGANQSASTRNDNDGTFIICRSFARVFIPAANTAVALSEFSWDGTPTSANATFAQLGMTRVELFINGKPLYRSPIPTSLVFGTGDKPLFNAFRTRVAPGATLTAKLYNDSGQSAQAILGWEGFKVPA